MVAGLSSGFTCVVALSATQVTNRARRWNSGWKAYCEAYRLLHGVTAAGGQTVGVVLVLFLRRWWSTRVGAKEHESGRRQFE